MIYRPLPPLQTPVSALGFGTMRLPLLHALNDERWQLSKELDLLRELERAHARLTE